MPTHTKGATPRETQSRRASSNFSVVDRRRSASYILQKQGFRERAETEAAARHPELMEKYRFLETLVDHTPVTTIRLSRQYLESLEESARAR